MNIIQINEKIVENLVNIGKKYCNVVLEENEKYLVRLSNGMCFLLKGTNVTEKFGLNAFIDLSKEPGIYCKGDLDHIDNTFVPRLLYRIMEIKKLSGLNKVNGMWESDLDMDLYNKKAACLLGQTW